MNFGEAIQAMKDGKRVCRKGWETVWLAINNLEYGRPSFIYLGIDNAAFDKGHPWTPSQSEMMAEDWEIKAEPPKKKQRHEYAALFLPSDVFLCVGKS